MKKFCIIISSRRGKTEKKKCLGLHQITVISSLQQKSSLFLTRARFDTHTHTHTRTRKEPTSKKQKGGRLEGSLSLSLFCLIITNRERKREKDVVFAMRDWITTFFFVVE